jgi:hypothetical protein
MVRKNGCMILRLLSSQVRFSFSFVGGEEEEEIMASANIEASVNSTS